MSANLTRAKSRLPATTLESRHIAKAFPSAIVIGASTGGPQALDVLLKGITPALRAVPAFVVLHLPAEFTAVIASHVSKLTELPASVAKNGDEIHRGHIYFAPAGLHLGIERVHGVPRIVLSDDPPENFCRPSVDFLFRAAARFYGSHVLGIVLTGMGQDGMMGARAISEAGGTVIAQDAASSVVWGMPGSVANAGLADAVLPIQAMSLTICDIFRFHSDRKSTS